MIQLQMLAWMTATATSDVIDWRITREIVTESTQVDFGWVVFGISAQLLFIAGLIGHWVATRRRKRLYLPKAVVCAGLFASVMLLVYAAVRHDIVFVVGQVLNMVIGFRLLELVTRLNAPEPRFPDVRPDTADRSRTNLPR